MPSNLLIDFGATRTKSALLDLKSNILRQPCFCEDDIKLRIGGGDLQNSRDLSEQDFAKLPATEHIMRGSFWLGVWPGLKEEDFERVPALFEKFTKNMAAKKK